VLQTSVLGLTRIIHEASGESSGREATPDFKDDLVVKTESSTPTGVCADDTANGEDFCGYPSQLAFLMNYPG
jgi:hypothetical protein